MKSQKLYYFKDIVTMTYHDKGKELPVPMVCQKIIATNGRGPNLLLV
jgi:hypothetical protein